MIEIKLDHPGSLPEHILKVLEKNWGYTLPKSYRDFLLKHNGGEPNPDCITFKNSQDDGTDIRSFLAIYPDDHNDLLNHIKLYKDRLPRNLFPIAKDSCGNLIVLSVMEPDRGKVYFWDHEREANQTQGELPDYSNLILIADSFDEFIAGLHTLKEASIENI